MKQGNILKIKSLSKSWCDNDKVMLHACFKLLVNCIEKENLLSNETFDWKHSNEVVKEKKELELLYKWWQQRVKKDLKVDSLNDAQYHEDNSMLIRLIKIRHRLWT
jgi:hypothetical protein